jgi:hypothetical protein
MMALIQRVQTVTRAPILNSLRRIEPQVVNEIGCVRGQTTQAIDENLRQRGKPQM